MEDLNKNQIVLLTLLVSFITSIATGIMTVSLLQEAPIEVTRNINRIVEKTIETVTPSVILPEKQTAVTTVVVKEEDMIIDSINKNIKSIVRIEEKDAVTGLTDFYGIGLVVAKDGLVAADKKTISNQNVYTGTMSDGTEIVLTPTGVSKDTDFILFKAAQSEKSATGTTTPAKPAYVFTPATMSASEPKLGQTLIGLGGTLKNSVVVGRVVSLDMKDLKVGTTTTQYLATIDTDVSTKGLVNGSPLFNLSGDVVGVRLASNPLGSFTPIAILKEEIQSSADSPKTP